ncbi:hypothetical protein [uncultured Roseobacter sp.]|uniref:hypothetical protein n=1 Tax=uncultured Roseobacter sp. TaxID=114847 RepID=UPI0026280DC1|nr:hypothetical protein [uncultured Roseobacter sp.]
MDLVTWYTLSFACIGIGADWVLEGMIQDQRCNQAAAYCSAMSGCIDADMTQ